MREDVEVAADNIGIAIVDAIRKMCRGFLSPDEAELKINQLIVNNELHGLQCVEAFYMNDSDGYCNEMDMCEGDASVREHIWDVVRKFMCRLGDLEKVESKPANEPMPVAEAALEPAAEPAAGLLAATIQAFTLAICVCAC
jgi:hypothetical protein